MKLFVLSTLLAAVAAVPAGRVVSRDPCADAVGCTQTIYNGDDEYYCCTPAQSSLISVQCAASCHTTSGHGGFACTGGNVGWHCHEH